METGIKITKTNVYRLEIERRTCGCRAWAEFEDPQYRKMVGDGNTVLCDKHMGKSEDAREILGEMLLDTLASQAEQAGKQYAPLRQNVAEGDSGGVQAEGESVQAMGVNMPNRQLQNGPRRDPTEVRQMQVDRPVPRGHTASTGSLNTAMPEGIEFSEEIGVEAEEDPNLSAFLRQTMDGIGDMLDQDDAKLQGVPQRYLKDEE